MRQKIEKIFHLIIQAIFSVVGRFPKRNLIIFESFHGRQYSDNPRAIYEYISQNHTEYQAVWAVKSGFEAPFIENHVPYVTRLGPRWLFTMPRARYWIFNTRMPLWMKKSKFTTYIQTWHGTPLKKIGIDIQRVKFAEEGTKEYRSEFIAETRRWDYLISPNHYTTKIFRQAFAYQGEILETGYPRNDLLCSQPSKLLLKQICQRLNIDASKKIILYAPTWRDDESFRQGRYKFINHFPFESLLESDDQLIILTRLHYLVSEQFDASQYGNRVLDVTEYSDIKQLYLIADLLITDYSSVMFDFALTKRPMLFFMYDQDKYQNEIRGFYFNPETELPGRIIKAPSELADAVQMALYQTENDSIVKRYQAFYERYCINNKHSAQQIFDKTMR
jgi:CDP-glycerol glycerophosphotransferase